MADKGPYLGGGRLGGNRHGRLLAGFAGNDPRARRIQPPPLGDEYDQRFRQFCDQREAGGWGDIVTRQQGFADGRNITETLDHAVDRERRNLGHRISH